MRGARQRLGLHSPHIGRRRGPGLTAQPAEQPLERLRRFQLAGRGPRHPRRIAADPREVAMGAVVVTAGRQKHALRRDLGQLPHERHAALELRAGPLEPSPLAGAAWEEIAKPLHPPVGQPRSRCRQPLVQHHHVETVLELAPAGEWIPGPCRGKPVAAAALVIPQRVAGPP